MVARAAELARDSHARTRHAAVLVKDGSMLGWGTNGVPYPGEDHCYCKVGDFGQHDQCRIHAEQRAITLAREGDGWRLLPGAKLIYVRLEADDSVRLDEPHFCAAVQQAGAVPGRGGVDLHAVRGPGRVRRGRLRQDRPAPVVIGR